MKKSIVTAVLIGSMLVSANSVFAAGNGAGYGDQDKLRDGSCLAIGNQVKDQLKDESCLVAIGNQVKDQLKDESCLVALGDQVKDQLKDESCLVALTDTKGSGDQDQLRDESCLIA